MTLKLYVLGDELLYSPTNGSSLMTLVGVGINHFHQATQQHTKQWNRTIINKTNQM